MKTRTTEQIISRMNQSTDLFGIQKSDLIGALPFKDAKPYLVPHATEEDWKVQDPKAEATEYLAFAWEKANNCRGLSAARSMYHYKAWLWLMGIDDVSWLDNYEMYDKPFLVSISVLLDADYKQWDDGEWVNEEGGDNLFTEEKLQEAIKFGEHLKSLLPK